jgi:hypothetical protein
MHPNPADCHHRFPSGVLFAVALPRRGPVLTGRSAVQTPPPSPHVASAGFPRGLPGTHRLHHFFTEN